MPTLRTFPVRWNSETALRNPQSYVKITLKALHYFSLAGSRLACPSSTEEWLHRGQEGSSPGLHPILPPALLGCQPAWPPKPMVSTILPISNICTSLKKKSMQLGVNTSFFKNLVFQIQIIEASLKKKIQLPHNYIMWKEHSLNNGSKLFLNMCDQFSPASKEQRSSFPLYLRYLC